MDIDLDTEDFRDRSGIKRSITEKLFCSVRFGSL